jgi:putative protein-disulfide isomerase
VHQPGIKSQFKKDNHSAADPVIDITIYTDPLCCWSWAFEPQLEKIKAALSQRAIWTYRMGGLIPTWKNFHDEVNSVTRPVQMGPVWMHAGQVANMPIHHQIWMQDPPSSSYPACIAVKAVQLQSPEAGTLYLKMLRNACMVNGENIAKEDVLFRIAKALKDIFTSLDLDQFQKDYHGDAARDEFREDLDLVRKYNINRFPTLIVKAGVKAIMIPGYRQHEEVLNAIQQITPGKTGSSGSDD